MLTGCLLEAAISWNPYNNPRKLRNFPGGPVVKNPPYNEGDAGSILVRELRSHMFMCHNY